MGWLQIRSVMLANLYNGLCAFYIANCNQLPLLHSIIDVETSGPDGFKGTLWKTLPNCENLPVTIFTPIYAEEILVDKEHWSYDQKYLFYNYNAIKNVLVLFFLSNLQLEKNKTCLLAHNGIPHSLDIYIDYWTITHLKLMWHSEIHHESSYTCKYGSE